MSDFDFSTISFSILATRRDAACDRRQHTLYIDSAAQHGTMIYKRKSIGHLLLASSLESCYTIIGTNNGVNSVPNFKCVNCGASSLVRSNFRLTPAGVTFCKREKCDRQRLYYLQTNPRTPFVQNISIDQPAKDSVAG